MNILSIQSYPGHNIYSHKSVIKAVIDLEDLYDTPTRKINGFNKKLLSILPGLSRHFCCCGYEGGFLERLEEGTYPAHVTEHIALELENMAGYKVSFGRSRLLNEPSIYSVVFEYINDKSATECLLAAVEIFNSLAAGNQPDISGYLENIRKVAAETDLGPSTSAIYDEAKRRGIPVTRLGNGNLLQLGYGKYARLLEAALTDAPGCIAVDMAGNKQLTKEMLSLNGIPVPHGFTAYTAEGAISAAEQVGYPVVVKPFDANQGKGVTLDVKSAKDVAAAYCEAVKYSKAALVEEYIRGRDYRVLVVGGKVAAVAERIPPYVTGDGIRTVKKLVDEENLSSLRGDDHEKPLTRLKLDDIALKILQKSGKGIDYVPEAGEKVLLRYNGNLSTGGTAIDCTDELHPINAELAVKAAEVMGLDIAGIDITAENIADPIYGGKGAVIEVNAAPGLRMHLFPSEGEKRNVAADILDMLFPEDKQASIPIVSVTGTNGKTTTTRLISHTISLMGKVTGMTSTSGVFVGGECILKGDNTGPASARIVLSNKKVEAAVLETARGGIIRRGLGYDLADVGVVVNVSEDHLGIDGITTLEELAHVKSLVLEAVKPGGYAVVNADDAMTPYLMERIKCRAIMFSSIHNNELMEAHMKAGGKAVYVNNGTICLYDGRREYKVAGISEIPITFNGMAACNIENSLAAVSALYALNTSLLVIREGLKTFKPDKTCNPGRMNIFDMGFFRIMLDYGHNPAGFKAVADMLPSLEAQRYVGVIGMPGDRTDKSMREAAAICAKAFSMIYIKEDRDLRGRDPGEVADIFYDAVISSGLHKDQAEIVYSELEALKAAIRAARDGDLIVVFYEDFEPVAELVTELKEYSGRTLTEAEYAGTAENSAG